MNIITLTLFFLTGNTHKFQEVKAFIESSGVNAIISQKNVPLVEIQSDSIEEVAKQKVQSIKEGLQGNYFVEDAGFFVEHLKDFPGVFSSYVHKMIGNEGVLKLMRNIKDRRSSFRSVIALMFEGEVYTFSGEVKGSVSYEIRGSKGFGYDPIFIPENLEKTFAEIPISEKNSLSHRIQALRKMCAFLLNKERK